MHDLIAKVLPRVSPFVSDVDVESGSEWDQRIHSELKGASFGIICVTKDNLFSPWMYYEAGFLSCSLGGADLCPYLLHLDIRRLPEPLSRRQVSTSDYQSTVRLFHAMNRATGNTENPGELEARLRKRWSVVADALQEIASKSFERPRTESERGVAATIAHSEFWKHYFGRKIEVVRVVGFNGRTMIQAMQAHEWYANEVRLLVPTRAAVRTFLRAAEPGPKAKAVADAHDRKLKEVDSIIRDWTKAGDNASVIRTLNTFPLNYYDVVDEASVLVGAYIPTKKHPAGVKGKAVAFIEGGGEVKLLVEHFDMLWAVASPWQAQQ